jgi:hypothetical protein
MNSSYVYLYHFSVSRIVPWLYVLSTVLYSFGMPRQLHNALPEPTHEHGVSNDLYPGVELSDGQLFRFKVVIHPSITNSGDLAIKESLYGAESIPETFSVVGADFEMTMDSSLHDAISRRGFGKTRNEFLQLTRDIMSDPHGENSIDEFKTTDAGRMARLVHGVTGPLEDLLPGKKLAIKGTGLDMEASRTFLEANGPHRSFLTKQFRDTLLLSRAQQQLAPEGIGGLVFINKVYGVIRWRDDQTGGRQEWMLMEQIEGAKSVKNVNLAMSNGDSVPGFERSDYPDLAVLTDNPYLPMDKDDFVTFADLSENLASALKLNPYGPNEISDLNGNNLLHQKTAEGSRYTLIDIG